MDNPFVGFETFTKQRTDDDEHPYGEDSHLDEDSILERTGDVETGDNYYEPDDYDEDDDVDLQLDGPVAGQTAQAAGQKVAGPFGKSHDDMMTSLDQAIGFMEKQVDTDEETFYDEPTGNRTAVRNVSRRGMVEEDDVDSLETSEEFEYTPELNEAQIATIQEAKRERRQGIEENEAPEARSRRPIRNPAAAALRDEDEEREFQREWVQSGRNRTPISSKRRAQRNEEDRKRQESIPGWTIEEGRTKRLPLPSTRQRVLTPENISTTARQNLLEEEGRRKRAEKSQIIREKSAAIRDTPIIPMERPERSETLDDDPFAQSADSVLAKALGSVIGIMEKQDPRFRCQECGTKIPKGSRSCRKCGSEDIDLA